MNTPCCFTPVLLLLSHGARLHQGPRPDQKQGDHTPGPRPKQSWKGSPRGPRSSIGITWYSCLWTVVVDPPTKYSSQDSSISRIPRSLFEVHWLLFDHSMSIYPVLSSCVSILQTFMTGIVCNIFLLMELPVYDQVSYSLLCYSVLSVTVARSSEPKKIAGIKFR